MKWALLALLFLASPAAAAEIPVGGKDLFGAAFGSGDDETVATIRGVLGEPTEDTGRIAGCELNGVDERYVSWGGLTAQFEENEGRMVFMRWVYQLDWETGKPIAGGPAPGQIVLPGGVRIGDPFSKAARAWGFKPEIDEVFAVAMYFTPEFGIMTRDPDIDAPISEVGTPGFAFCE